MQALHTPRLVLEPLTAAHAGALYPLLCEPALLEFIERAAPASEQALRERYRRLEARRSPDGRERWLNWALMPRDGGVAIGYVQATVLEDRRAWVGYEVGSAWWGRGFATEAVRTMVGHLRAEHGVAQCLASVDRRNERSWRLLQRLGFERVRAEGGDWLYAA